MAQEYTVLIKNITRVISTAHWALSYDLYYCSAVSTVKLEYILFWQFNLGKKNMLFILLNVFQTKYKTFFFLNFTFTYDAYSLLVFSNAKLYYEV